jgi:hypothetical protein
VIGSPLDTERWFGEGRAQEKDALIRLDGLWASTSNQPINVFFGAAVAPRVDSSQRFSWLGLL